MIGDTAVLCDDFFFFSIELSPNCIMFIFNMIYYNLNLYYLYFSLVAKAMVDMHGCTSQIEGEVEIFKLIRNFYKNLPDKFDDEENQKRYINYYIQEIVLS